MPAFILSVSRRFSHNVQDLQVSDAHEPGAYKAGKVAIQLEAVVLTHADSNWTRWSLVHCFPCSLLCSLFCFSPTLLPLVARYLYTVILNPHTRTLAHLHPVVRKYCVPIHGFKTNDLPIIALCYLIQAFHISPLFTHACRFTNAGACFRNEV